MCFLIIKDGNNTDIVGIVEKIVLSMVPFLLTIILEIYFVVRILFEFFKNRELDQKSINIKYLILYPLFLVLFWSWIMFERFYELVSNGE